MITGAAQVDAVILVVALNKADTVEDPELLALVELEVRTHMSQYTISGRGTVVTGAVERGVARSRRPGRGRRARSDGGLGGDRSRDVRQDARAARVGDATLPVRGHVLNAHRRGGVPATGFAANYRPQFFFRTINVWGGIELAEGGVVRPGDHAELTVEHGKPVALEVGRGSPSARGVGPSPPGR